MPAVTSRSSYEDEPLPVASEVDPTVDPTSPSLERATVLQGGAIPRAATLPYRPNPVVACTFRISRPLLATLGHTSASNSAILPV